MYFDNSQRGIQAVYERAKKRRKKKEMWWTVRRVVG